jgi:toluene monooxygenase system ferredoxin subunit
MTWNRVATLDDLWDGEMLGIRIGDRDVLLCNLGGEVFAYEDRCPHLANPLSAGHLHEGVLTCAAHEWVFDLRTGAGVNPSLAKLINLPVQLDGDWILVDCIEDVERVRE